MKHIMFKGTRVYSSEIVYGYYVKLAEPFRTKGLIYKHYIYTGNAQKVNGDWCFEHIRVQGPTVEQFIKTDMNNNDIYEAVNN